MQVPLLDLTAQFASIEPEVKKAVDTVFSSQRFILGPEVKGLEEAVAAYCDVPHAVGCASGSDALLLALMALGIGPGDDVLTTPYTFFATAGSIARLGARPVFCDIDPVTFNIDPNQVERRLTAATRAILPVHLFGQCADIDPVLKIAEKRGIPVIEDAAQAIGATYGGRRAGSMGLFGCFSFFPSKNLGGAGDGGMIVTQDSALARRLRVLRVHGSDPKYVHPFVGINSRLDTIQAAVLLVKLKYLDGWSEGRRRNAAEYDRAFAGLPGITTPRISENCRSIYNQYVVRVRERDQLIKQLTSAGIGSEIYYPTPLHLQDCFSYLGYRKGDFPHAEAAAADSVALPIYPELRDHQKSHVISTVSDFLSSLRFLDRSPPIH